MTTNNLFNNIYTKKTDEELISIVKDAGYTDDAKLCALAILKNRGVDTSAFQPVEKEMIQLRDSRLVSSIAHNKYETGGARFVALIIDGMILNFAGWFLSFLNNMESAMMLWIIGIFQMLLPYLYSIFLHGYCGQTIGKMATNVKIYDQSEKQLISYKQALIRDSVPLSILVLVQVLSLFTSMEDYGWMLFIGMSMLFLMVFWSILEIITMLFDSKKRALHDYMAGTVVLKINS